MDERQQTPERDPSLVAVLAAELSNHIAIGPAGPSASAFRQRDRIIERTKINAAGTEGSWSVFLKKWDLFKSG